MPHGPRIRLGHASGIFYAYTYQPSHGCHIHFINGSAEFAMILLQRDMAAVFLPVMQKYHSNGKNNRNCPPERARNVFRKRGAAGDPGTAPDGKREIIGNNAPFLRAFDYLCSVGCFINLSREFYMDRIPRVRILPPDGGGRLPREGSEERLKTAETDKKQHSKTFKNRSK